MDGKRRVDPTFRVWADTVKTDRQGRFRIAGLVPGQQEQTCDLRKPACRAAPRVALKNGASPRPEDLCMAAAPLNRLVHQLRQTTRACRLDDRSDRELLEHHRGGDAAAFEALVWRHGPAVLSVCRGVLGHEADAEGAFQATFLLLLRNAHSIRRGDAIGGWLCSVAHRIVVQVLTAALSLCLLLAEGVRQRAVAFESKKRSQTLLWTLRRAQPGEVK